VAELLTPDAASNICLADARARSGSEAEVDTIIATTFPDSALGAPRRGEMAAAMMTPGWTIRVSAGAREFEYRANPRQVRLVAPDGENVVVFPV